MMNVCNDFRGLITRFTLSALCLTVALPSLAQETSSDFKITGFLSIVGGKVLKGDLDSNYSGPSRIYQYDCSCYIADWANAGVYNKSFSLKPESHIGLQIDYKPSTQLSFTGQVLSRGTEGKPNIQWAYGSYKLNSNWEVQIGRKRIPLYYYSDFQDVGISYPWVTPPPELYGWEATNYNGGSLRYTGNIGDTNFNASLLMGSEKVKDSPYQMLYYSGKNEVTWKGIVGADLELSQGAFTVRGVYLKADVTTKIFSENINDPAKLKAYGLAINADFDDWYVLGEITQLSRFYSDGGYTVTAPAMTIGYGRRIDQWTIFANYANYDEKSTDESIYMPQKFKRTSLTVRYDLNANSAVKAQIDRNRDVTNNFGGTTTVLRLSYDRVF